jgi:hypothetical protein
VEEKHCSRGITLYVEDKGESLCIWKYTYAEREILPVGAASGQGLFLIPT